MRIFTIGAIAMNSRDAPAELSGFPLDDADLADLATAVLREMNERFGAESNAPIELKASMAATCFNFDSVIEALRESGVQF